MRAYLSHSIRGKEGKNATKESMTANNKRAKEFAKLIRNITGVDSLHVPAEYEEFVDVAYRRGYMNEEMILATDCAIIDECDMVIVYTPDNYISTGMAIEIHHATLEGIPIYFIDGSMKDYQIESFIVGQINKRLENQMRG